LSAGQLNLDKIIDQAQVLIGPFAEAKDVVLDCRRGGLTVSGEEDKLVRVFTNLLGNAVRYAPRETSILVVSKSQDGFAQVNISDKGPGISAQNIGTIFDAFSPSAGGENIELSSDMVEDLPPGSVGLALTKAFVELHGGKISAASKAGEGTTFSFTLPLDLGKF
jgi:signal transduction histidine kinase